MPEPKGRLVTPVGFNGSGYPKAGNVPFGYAESLVIHTYDLTAAAGTNDLTLDTVPTGEIWVLIAMSGRDETSACDRIGLYITDGALDYYLKIGDPGVANVTIDWNGQVLVPSGWDVAVLFTGVTSGDDIHSSGFGYKMTV